MKIAQLISILQPKQVISNGVESFDNISFDSRNVGPGFLFIAIRGTLTDGHTYIDDVCKRGAVAVICEEIPNKASENLCWIQVPDSGKALALTAAAFYGNPSRNLKLVGVTGTNGKTTIATTLYNLVTSLGYKAGLLSTVKNIIDGDTVAATHTTPDAITINRLFAEMVARGCEYCFMEVSSHAIVQHRTTGLSFAGGIFTNITHDHLDYHKTFDAYIRAKKLFFDQLPRNAFAITNADDKNGSVMVQNSQAAISDYGVQRPADYKAQIIESHFDGMLLNIDGHEMWSHFTGKFNASNLLAVYATALKLGFSSIETLQALSGLHPVDGRFQTINAGCGITAIVDYAHTPDALINVLSTINQIRQEGNKIITVVGAGGNRDKTKRPVMAKVAAEMSDKLILTSDNPRNENPEDILSEMETGLDYVLKAKTLKITDRREAIRTACMLATPGDVVLIAGKGHENYQEINGVKHHFDDKETVSEILKQLI